MFNWWSEGIKDWDEYCCGYFIFLLVIQRLRIAAYSDSKIQSRTQYSKLGAAWPYYRLHKTGQKGSVCLFNDRVRFFHTIDTVRTEQDKM